MAKWKCNTCDYVYNPVKGDISRLIKKGTDFEKLPEAWTCPKCKAPKNRFSRM